MLRTVPSIQGTWTSFRTRVAFLAVCFAGLPGVRAHACEKGLTEPKCWDQEFTCHRCCDTRAIPTGDMSCWEGDATFPTCCGLTRVRFATAQIMPATDHLTGEAHCPPNAHPHCFDDYFPCERCCDTRRGVEGDRACWPDTEQWGLRTLSFAFCCGVLPFESDTKTRW
mmetsp:Transcript_4147/g.11696  ORF Transcript_4147/g.11696 Transcript_4147/m.11696 type:complete len:168 (-) Transcript_4147:16-519(-)